MYKSCNISTIFLVALWMSHIIFSRELICILVFDDTIRKCAQIGWNTWLFDVMEGLTIVLETRMSYIIFGREIRTEIVSIIPITKNLLFIEKSWAWQYSNNYYLWVVFVCTSLIFQFNCFKCQTTKEKYILFFVRLNQLSIELSRSKLF